MSKAAFSRAWRPSQYPWIPAIPIETIPTSNTTDKILAFMFSCLRRLSFFDMATRYFFLQNEVYPKEMGSEAGEDPCLGEIS